MRETFYQAGFDWAVHGDAPYVMPIRGRKEDSDFDAGIAVGKEVLLEIGGIKKLRDVLSDTDRIRKKALDAHDLFLSSIASMPKLEREKMKRAHRLEPCALCRNISICAVTARTCAVFRTYAARGGWNEKDQRVPDRFLSELAEEPDDGMREVG